MLLRRKEEDRLRSSSQTGRAGFVAQVGKASLLEGLVSLIL